MDSLAPSASTAPAWSPHLSGWARPPQSGADLAEAAFRAGAALHALDQLVRSEPVWAGAWRQRLALKCAASACRLAGRDEHEAALRHAWMLRRGDDDPGPAGNVLAAWRRLAVQPPDIDTDSLAHIVEKLGLRWDVYFTELPDQFNGLVRTGPAAPFAASEAMRGVTAAAPDAELLAWWLADLVLAQKLRCPRALLGAGASGDGGLPAGGRHVPPGRTAAVNRA